MGPLIGVGGLNIEEMPPHTLLLAEKRD